MRVRHQARSAWPRSIFPFVFTGGRKMRGTHLRVSIAALTIAMALVAAGSTLFAQGAVA